MILLLMLIAGCAAGSENFIGEENTAGFWAGLWHGLISFFTFIIGIFNQNVDIYEVNNAGTLYDFGFILGVMIFFGSGGSTVRVRDKGSKHKSVIAEQIKTEILKSINEWMKEVDEEKYESKKDMGEDIEEKIKRDLRDWE
jgi:hypothetical protein